MSYAAGLKNTEHANARLRAQYLQNQVEHDRRRDQRLAKRERQALGRTRHSTFTPPERPKRHSDQTSAELLAADFQRRSAELRRERKLEEAEAIRNAKARAAAAEERS